MVHRNEGDDALPTHYPVKQYIMDHYAFNLDLIPGVSRAKNGKSGGSETTFTPMHWHSRMRFSATRVTSTTSTSTSVRISVSTSMRRHHPLLENGNRRSNGCLFHKPAYATGQENASLWPHCTRRPCSWWQASPLTTSSSWPRLFTHRTSSIPPGNPHQQPPARNQKHVV